ncbi:MAG: hypothetical protein KKA10_17940, partial [Euryarchaeota archaeon]|nr:hypothetical protein [Euryarchaeota archaeon]
MIVDESQDKKVMDLFMDDSLWINRIKKKEKIVETEQRIEEKPEEKELIKVKKYETPEKEGADEKGFGEVDYAILKSITYGFKDIKQISGALQIRTLIVEKHVYALIKE